MINPFEQMDRQQSQRAPPSGHSRDNLFQYEALESQDAFRLLKLHAGQADRLHCSIHHHTLRSPPTYTAVSYTWGKDAARFCIHLPNSSVIRVRENLWNALRSMRDTESDCWVWVDAICINQDSDSEKNQQVRLMASIYGKANIVAAWLQSAGDKPDIAAKALKVVKSAATSRGSQHLVDDERILRSVQSLCGLRYWTRKWIIQELVHARTVVLQSGDQKCSMANLEKILRQLNQNGRGDAYKSMTSTKRRICDLIVKSPAARLALQRSDVEDNRQPRHLYKLIERYANNECQEPCDHVYALYSLVGEHRHHLSIDYGASVIQRLVAVLHFVQTYEHLHPSKILEFTYLLVRLLKAKSEDLLLEQSPARNLDLVVLGTLLGTAEVQGESEGSMALRDMIKPLKSMPTFQLDISSDVWLLTSGEPQDEVGRKDMPYFRIAGTKIYGLAACYLRSGDTIWHLPKTQLGLVVRRLSDHPALILGRAYLYTATRKPDIYEHWLGQTSEMNTVQDISLDLATLLELGSLVIPWKNGRIDFMPNEKTRSIMDDWKAIWKRRWSSIIVAAGAILLFLLILAIVLTQVVKR